MTREWKPGDVAISKRYGIAVVSNNCEKHFARHEPHWHYVSSGEWNHLNDSLLDEHRPLVVIDPEDSERVAALMGRFSRIDGRIFGVAGVDDMQQALREFANPKPPKPDEPMGLGAVVETVHGEIYVRDKTTTTVAHWKRAKGEESGKRHRYADLDAVRVLSPGWEPDQ